MDLLSGLKRPENTNFTTLSCCYSKTQVSLAWAALWQLPFSGMPSSWRVLDPIVALLAVFPSGCIHVMTATAC